MLQLWFFDSVVGNHMRAYRRNQNKYGLDNESYHVWGLVELREPCTKVLSPPLSHKLCNFFNYYYYYFKYLLYSFYFLDVFHQKHI